MTPAIRRVTFRDGKLVTSVGDRVLVLRAWPDCAAWAKRSSGPWRGTSPFKRVFTEIHQDARRSAATRARRFRARLAVEKSPLLEPDRATELAETLARLSAGWTTRQHASASFLEAFPPQVLDLVLPLPERQWHVMQLLGRCPGALDLAATNPALAFALASNTVFHRPQVSRPLRAARALVRRRRKDIAAYLGFPGTAATVNLLSKVRPSAITVPGLVALQRTLREPDPPKALWHLPVLDGFALRVLCNARLRDRVAFSFLAETARDPKADRVSAGAAAYLLEDAIRLEDALGIVSCKQVRSIEEVVRLHDARTEELNDRERDLAIATFVFPAPPIAGGESIAPITNVTELLDEGRAMHHCVGAYAQLVAEGKSFVYRVLAPGRATLALGQASGGWRIAQLKGPANEPVSPETEAAVRAWLADVSLPPIA